MTSLAMEVATAHVSLGGLARGAAAAALVYLAWTITYNLYLHPLARFPGPLLWKAFRIPFVYHMWRGQLPYEVRKLHDRYGPTVRIAPDELSYTHPDAWRDIYAKRESARPPQWGGQLPGLHAHTVVSAPGSTHARLRKAFAGGFSESAARKQEPLVNGYVDILMKRLHEEIGEPRRAVVKLAEWINFATFDIMGDFGWGTSFKCLDKGEYHPWILVVLWYKGLLVGVTLQLYPLLNRLMAAITPASAQDGVRFVVDTSRNNVERRYETASEQPDLMSYVMAYNEKNPGAAVTLDEAVANSSTIVVAGSDPLASVIAGAITYLIRDVPKLERLEREIRDAFKQEADITADGAKQLQYLHAVLMEAIRLCPPVPDNMRRLTPASGTIIAGEHVPSGTTVGITPYAAFRSADAFDAPDDFRPERWLSGVPDTAYHPFGFGPRSCAGQALAWLEMRLIMTRLLWNFDIRAAPGAEVPAWTAQKIYWTWQRDALPVSLAARSRPSATG